MASARGAVVQADSSAGRDQVADPSHPGGLRNAVMLLVELLLVLGVVHLYDIEGRRQLLPVLGLIFAGALVHSQLPRHWRLPFFAALSMGTILFVLGLAGGATVLAVGGGLIALCSLPVPFVVRVALLVVAGAALVTVRAVSDSPVWVVVGAMFMFRLAIYLYDTRRTTSRPPLAQTVSYFFMAPNVTFPFFPVVDYRTFCDTYNNENTAIISQRGTSWMLRGILHLLMYRFIKMNLIAEPWELQNIQSVALFLIANYGLYLQVSGQFHLITGMLHLFGFNLPRTHDNYFLASSVNDIWRRINIYWKDFLQKLFFFPCFFALRRRGIGAPAAIVCGVLLVFVATWLLHSWQTFWLLGEFPLQAQDAVLWLGVGVLVAANSLLEYRRARHPVRAKQSPTWGDDLKHAAMTVGMLISVSLFWVAWTRPGLLTQTAALLGELPGSSRGIVSVPLCLAGLVIGGAAARATLRRLDAARLFARRLTFQDTFAVHAVVLGGMVAVGLPWFSAVLPDGANLALQNFRSDIYFQQDPLAQLQSYYEDLNTVTVQSGPLLTALTPQETHRQRGGDEFLTITRRVNPWMGREPIPGWKGELAGHTIAINSHGMRDRATVTLRKPAETVRIALVGSSVVMGYAVADDEVFGLEFERLLNKNRNDDLPRIEVLNFGMGGQGPLHRVALVEQKVMAFQPDAIFYFAHQDELRSSLSHFSGLVSSRTPLKYSFLEEIVRDARITPETSPGVTLVRLGESSRLRRLVGGAYETLAAECRRNNVLPVWIYFPIPGIPDAPDLAPELIPLATEAGFVVLNLSDWHAGYDPMALRSGSADHHLSAEGHELFANQLFEAVLQRPDALPDAARVSRSSDP
ncbi:MAG: hypothetical protein KF861_01545 [Planctomycetaceae bacterium]|nr:hypothetical protein [Planctomycetaceae bacterium]